MNGRRSAVNVAAFLVMAVVVGLCFGSATAADHQHDFDFEFGSWTATLHMQAHPLTKSPEWVTYTGTSVVRKVWNGRANLGELEVGNGANHIEAMTLRIYDPKTERWSVYFANAKGGLETTPMIGRFENGQGDFYDSEELDGKPIKVRFIFSDITSTSFQFVQSFSADGGKTWIPNWISTFKR